MSDDKFNIQISFPPYQANLLDEIIKTGVNREAGISIIMGIKEKFCAPLILESIQSLPADSESGFNYHTGEIEDDKHFPKRKISFMNNRTYYY